MNTTDAQYDSALASCKDIFLKKTADYGTSWRVLRPISIVDQLFIKAQRIRTLQERKQRKVDEDISSEFIGMVNYGIIGLIQFHDDYDPLEEIPVDKVRRFYEEQAAQVKQVMENKNHDYGEAWREMSQESFADLILMKLMRMKQILANEGKTLISEGIDANYIDIINYSLFALILIHEGKHAT
jgi:hypothetical protein